MQTSNPTSKGPAPVKTTLLNSTMTRKTYTKNKHTTKGYTTNFSNTNQNIDKKTLMAFDIASGTYKMTEGVLVRPEPLLKKKEENKEGGTGVGTNS